jgi:hypothetical protein
MVSFAVEHAVEHTFGCISLHNIPLSVQAVEQEYWAGYRINMVGGAAPGGLVLGGAGQQQSWRPVSRVRADGEHQGLLMACTAASILRGLMRYMCRALHQHTQNPVGVCMSWSLPESALTTCAGHSSAWKEHFMGLPPAQHSLLHDITLLWDCAYAFNVRQLLCMPLGMIPPQ